MNDAPPLAELTPRSRVSAVKHAWSRGAEPDALAVLEAHPELLDDKAAVLDLGYEEFWRRWEAGAPPDPEAFVARFPRYRTSLRNVVQAHLILMDNAAVLEEPAPPRWPEAGECVGDLTLVRELGRGAFARVFLATEASTGDRPVVVKLSREGAAEARTLGPLAHPNIVPVLSARKDEASGLTAVCMPYLGSATLEDVLERAYPAGPGATAPRRAALILEAARPSHPVEVAEAPDPVLARGSYVEGVMRLGAQMADALAFLHARGVCHRDLKPSNVLLSPGGRPLLLDFNLSADAGVAAPHLGGTLPYMAPEHLEAFLACGGPADPPRLDERADLFSLGVILYELLTGQLPFGPVPLSPSSGHLVRYLLERQRQGFVPLRRANPAVDRRLARLVEGCLALSPAARPVSARAVAGALRGQFGLLARLRRWALRRPLATACLAAALALAGGGAGWAGSALVQARPSAEREYQRGRAAYVAGDLAGAEEGLSGAVRIERQQVPEHLFALGLVRMKRAAAMTDPAEKESAESLFAQAATDLEAATQQPSAEVDEGAAYACLAYCQARLRQWRLAIETSNKASEGGVASAEVWNNLAYCSLQMRDKEAEVASFLERALQLSPDLPAARFNRAVLACNARKTWGARPAGLTPLALEDIEKVLTTKPAGSKPYLYACWLYAFAARDLAHDRPTKNRYAERALENLRMALGHGYSGDIDKDRYIREVLARHPQYADLLKAGRPAAKRPPVVELIVPELAEPPVQLR